MPPRPSAARETPALAQPFPSANRAVHIAYVQGAWRVQSEDGDVGGIFVSQDAARRFAEREFRVGQGRPILDDWTTPQADRRA
jgi:hypothetical protein